MKAPWHFMKFGDWMVVLILLTIALAGIARVAMSPGGSRVVVTTGDQVIFAAPLDQPREVALDGPLGQTLLVIDDRGAHITGSPCPRKTCIAMGTARQTGDLIACVPNRIMVRIDGASSEETSYDLLSR